MSARLQTFEAFWQGCKTKSRSRIRYRKALEEKSQRSKEEFVIDQRKRYGLRQRWEHSTVSGEKSS